MNHQNQPIPQGICFLAYVLRHPLRRGSRCAKATLFQSLFFVSLSWEWTEAIPLKQVVLINNTRRTITLIYRQKVGAKKKLN